MEEERAGRIHLGTLPAAVLNYSLGPTMPSGGGELDRLCCFYTGEDGKFSCWKPMLLGIDFWKCT